MAKLRVDKEKLLSDINEAVRSGFISDEEQVFLVELVNNVEDLQRDASRYRMWKKLLDDPHLIKEVETILDKHIKQV